MEAKQGESVGRLARGMVVGSAAERPCAHSSVSFMRPLPGRCPPGEAQMQCKRYGRVPRGLLKVNAGASRSKVGVKMRSMVACAVASARSEGDRAGFRQAL